MKGPFFVDIDRKSSNAKPRVRVFIYTERNSDSDIEVNTLGAVFQMVREEVATLKAEGVIFSLDHTDVRIRIDYEFRIIPSFDWQHEGEPVMHELKQDGKLIEIGTVNYLYLRLHHIQGQSWDFAMKHGGYSIEPVKEDEKVTELREFWEQVAMAATGFYGFVAKAVECSDSPNLKLLHQVYPKYVEAFIAYSFWQTWEEWRDNRKVLKFRTNDMIEIPIERKGE